jgi:hypothetical protein
MRSQIVVGARAFCSRVMFEMRKHRAYNKYPIVEGRTCEAHMTVSKTLWV